jgi:hypothetical protein
MALPAVMGPFKVTGTWIVVGSPVAGSIGPGPGTVSSTKTPFCRTCALWVKALNIFSY